MFSESAGLIASAEKQGTPVTIEFNPEMKTRNLNIVSGETKNSQQQKYDKLFYRIPDVVNLKITAGNEVLGNSRKLIYQFGEVVRMPSNYIIGE
jgi:vancomycin resistance protein YoaR